MKVLLYALWAVALILVNKYLIDPLWGQLLFTFVTGGAVTAVATKMGNSK
ncbi:hypothetical protein San01_39760 [Streptomyces angustmyceticus]|uniref:Uncharacterized protein n=1 Tax=Streptomyces angustmyceticus TaxID=285578 RepID=A0A5J4LIV7_9ACTN|nr:hypothetical protein San01_39760 [Streptomyces angustmyceticus]